MGLRSDLHTLLSDTLASIGIWYWSPFEFEVDDIQSAIDKEAPKHIYFQPPESLKMLYPCIVYERYSGVTTFANNRPYNHHKRYTVTVITKDPDSEIPDKIAMLPTCIFNRHFTANNLHHFVYNLFY